MEHLLESWPLVLVLLCSFVIGWAAETAETFISRALALSILAWLQTLPEFAVEASVAWQQQRDLMIANLTGSLRLLVGLGWPMIFFTQFYFQGVRRREFIRQIDLGEEDALSVLFLFLSILYFMVIYLKASLTCFDSVILIGIYLAYLVLLLKLPLPEAEDAHDLPWVGKKILSFSKPYQIVGIVLLFVLGGVGLFVSVDPFIHTLQKWAVTAGISTFVFIQWVAPFLSEFPEKLSAFNWARQKGKAPRAVMNMVSSNINQWTMLAAMIPIVFNLSLGHWEPIHFDASHRAEIGLTLAQSLLGGLLLLDLSFSVWEAALLFCLWLAQFLWADIRLEVTLVYLVWTAWELAKMGYFFSTQKRLPRAIQVLGKMWAHGIQGNSK